MHNTTRHHATRTYQGKIACAGSHEPTKADGRSCSVCGRNGLAITVAGNIATHLHLLDLKARQYSSGPTEAEINSARSKEKAAIANAALEAELDLLDTPENVALVAAFAASPSSETFMPMIEAGLQGDHWCSLYFKLAERHGIELRR